MEQQQCKRTLGASATGEILTWPVIVACQNGIELARWTPTREAAPSADLHPAQTNAGVSHGAESCDYD